MVEESAVWAESCWRALCSLAVALRDEQPPVSVVAVRFGPGGEAVAVNGVLPALDGTRRLIIDLDESPCLHEREADAAVFGLERWVRLKALRAGRLTESERAMWSLYGVYALAPLLARAQGRAVSVSHFAQSLDGRIATVTGHSRWIGDDANREHAHRMRALCDAILVGVNTLRRDKPRLNVRHVPGEDPVRVVLGGGVEDLKALGQVEGAPALLIGARCAKSSERAEASSGVASWLSLPRDDSGRVSASAVLKALKSRGLNSVYIEGGSRTTSHFLNSSVLDIIQVHVAPLILGGGVSAFSLEGVDTVDEAVRFEHHCYVPVGSGVMFVGRARTKGDGEG